jgi:hypothetical protein
MFGAFRSSRVGHGRLLRPLVGIVVAYAVATQSLLIALGGFALAAPTDQTPPAIVLCHHEEQGPAELPNGNSPHAGCTHCLFCFAGAHVAVIGAQPVLLHRLGAELSDALAAVDDQYVPGLPPHSIAEPRGPPFRA